MIVDGRVKEMFVTRHDSISKFIEINNSIDSLARQFGLMKLIFDTMIWELRYFQMEWMFYISSHSDLRGPS